MAILLEQRVWLSIILATVALPMCSLAQEELTGRQPAATQPAAQWAAKEPSEWPQINLTNMAAFRGSAFLYGASAFLLQLNDQVYIASAKHLIGPAGGIEPKIPLAEFNERLLAWLVYPRTEEAKAIEGSSLVIGTENEKNHDWLLLSVKNAENLPAEPLIPASKQVEVGDIVYVIGVPYSEPERIQNVYEAVVTERDGTLFAYKLATPVNLAGFSGAPIVNKDGHVVGIMMIWFEREMKEEQDLFGGGQDVAELLNLLTDLQL